MRYFNIGFILVLSAVCMSLSAQNVVKMSAVRANDFGVAYSLPKTEIGITVSYTKTSRVAGPFYQYAERYLNISNPIIEDEVIYTLDKIDAVTKGVVDKSNSYLVEFKSNSIAPFLSLSEDGLICAINSDYKFDTKNVVKDGEKVVSTKLLNPNTFLSEEILRAGSTAKQAELIAKQIYRLRESRTNILTGEADNMPPDGDAYKLVMTQLDEQEKALMAMFVGEETVEKGVKTFSVIPDNKDMDRHILFRFSQKLGLVDSNDLSGAPVYLSLRNKEPKAQMELTPKEQQTLEKKFSKGVIYNIPGKGILKISFNNKSFVDTEIEVVQYGEQDVLTPQMFDNNKQPIKVIFYPEQGSIKQIIQ